MIGVTKNKQQLKSTGARGVHIECADAMDRYSEWPAPTCIIADGPYGLGKFPGEPGSPNELSQWYAPHVAAWAEYSRPDTTLWFWCTELGWALTHPVLDLHGWNYEECIVWDKGVAHIAGNCNSKTIRGTPVVTEVAVRYTRRNSLATDVGELPIKEWVRHEWRRSGLPMGLANDACGVRNAATRKYLTQCHLWYFPPPEALVAMARYCNEHGELTDRPYFSLDGNTLPTEDEWRAMRAKWNHTHGITNVWQTPSVHGRERIKSADGYLHACQKPISLMTRQIEASTDAGDVVWEPFGGLCSATAAAALTSRRAFAAENHTPYFEIASKRIKEIVMEANENVA